jgi:hypothetical protein
MIYFYTALFIITSIKGLYTFTFFRKMKVKFMLTGL